MNRRVLAVIALSAAATSVILTPTTAGAASDTQIAKAGVLVKKDLPSSWSSARSDSDSDRELERVAATIPECDEYLDSRERMKKATNAVSREFTSPDDEDFNNETWVFAKTSAARAAFAAMGAPGNSDCLTLLFQELFEAQIASDPTSAAQVTGIQTLVNETRSLPANGDDQLGYVGTVDLALVDGSAERLLLGYFAVRSGRGVLGYTVVAPAAGNTFSGSFASAVEEAIDTSATRMEKALKK